MSSLLSLAGNAAPTGFYDFPLEQSLRFEDGDSAYLSRTPTTAGNRKTFTYSTWVKRGNLGLKTFISAGTGDTARTLLFFDGSDKIVFGNNTGSGYFGTQTNAVFRDVSAWYHIVFSIDTTQATTADRVKIYVNGVQQTDTSAWNSGYIAQNTDTYINNTSPQVIGSNPLYGVRDFYDGFKAEVNLIDGSALEATSFGELKSGIWTPRDTSGLSYGTNGFRLNFADTVTASGFNTLTWTGDNTNGGNSVNGCGFSPDLVWAKCRSVAYSPLLYDSIRGTGATAELKSDGTEVEGGSSSSERGYLNSFDSDGFSSVVGSNGDNLYFNQSGQTYVAWCWDAGSGSPVSNTDGSITSTVKANTDYGFSVVTYTGNATAGATLGHSLGVAPDVIITKARGAVSNWFVYHSANTAEPETEYLTLETTNATTDNSTVWNDTAPTSSVFSIGQSGWNNTSGVDYVAYCFAEKTGYSKFGSFVGTGAAGNSITTGFRPAFIMIKRTDAAFGWYMYDTTRQVQNPMGSQTDPLVADTPNAEGGADPSWYIDVTDTGFTINNTSLFDNASGGTYIYMAFADTRDAAFWRDVSGQGNDWQPNNLTFSDVVPDGTNNFAVLNNLDNISTTYSEGNLKISQSSYNYNSRGSFGLTSGKYYWEVRMDSTHGEFGVCENGKMPQTDPQGAYPAYFIYNNGSTGVIYNNATSASSSSATMTNWAAGDVAMIAYDADNGNLYHGLNGVWQNSADPAAGTGAIITGITTQFGGELVPFFGSGTASARNWIINFGQDSTFAGNTTAGGNADENGYGDFKYAPPSGYLSLCSANLPTGAIDTLADETPEDYFNTVLWTGTSATQSITGVGFQPSLTWIKERSQARDHVLSDAVRGGDGSYLYRLYSSQTWSESTYTSGDFGAITSFDSDGFTVDSSNGSYIFTNTSGQTYVGWNWKANGSGVSNTDGSITSTVSVGATSQQNWFSVVSWTGTGANATVGHGLDGTVPDLVIVKNRDIVSSWLVRLQTLATNQTLLLENTTTPISTDYWQSTQPDSSVFSVSSNSEVNGSGNNLIAYCFANAEGLCKVGTYVGNGSTDGSFIYTGFRPSYVLCRRYDAAAGWHIFDNERANPFNVIDQRLEADNSDAEGTTSGLGIDLLSNGFKFRGSFDNINGSGNSCLYLAIAEQPFKYANAR